MQLLTNTQLRLGVLCYNWATFFCVMPLSLRPAPLGHCRARWGQIKTGHAPKCSAKVLIYRSTSVCWWAPMLPWCYIKRGINYADVVIVALRKKKKKSPNAFGASPRISRNAGPRSSITQSQSRGAKGCILRIRRAQIGKLRYSATRDVIDEDQNIIPVICLNHIHLTQII